MGLPATGVVDLGLEGAVAVAEEDADGAGAVVGGDEVELAVVVEVGGGHAAGRVARGEDDAGAGEGARERAA